jgi:hypothetical protein
MNEIESVDVIHQLKNHIAIIVSYCDLLLSEVPDDDRRRADIVEVHKAGKEAMALIPEVARRIRSGSRS